MGKIKFGIGGLVMLAAMMISDSAAVFAVYFCAALFHETGHLLAAKLLGIGIKEIRFDFSGARILIDERVTSYGAELLLSLSGPLANLLTLGAILTGGRLCGVPPWEMLEAASAFLAEGYGGCAGVIGFFALSSLLQAATNLLPVSTFDGGRALYCAIAPFNERAAERVLSAASVLSAFLLWTVALYLMLKISSGLGIYVFAACIFASAVANGRETG